MVVAAQFGAGSAQAAVARVSIGVSVQVLQDCAALLSSSTTMIAASFACRGDSVATTLSPTVTSTSLAVLAPSVVFGSNQGRSSSDPAAADGSKASSGGVQLAPGGSIFVGPSTNQFAASTTDADDKIVVVTY